MSEEKKMGVLDRYRDRDRSAEEALEYAREEFAAHVALVIADIVTSGPCNAGHICKMMGMNPKHFYRILNGHVHGAVRDLAAIARVFGYRLRLDVQNLYDHDHNHDHDPGVEEEERGSGSDQVMKDVRDRLKRMEVSVKDLREIILEGKER